MIDKERRDYEKERDELLKIMEKHVSKEVKEAIEITIAAQTTTEPPRVKISHKGAFDAE